MEINMLGSLAVIEKMDLDNTFGPTEIHIKEILAKIWDKEKDKWHGMMAAYIQDSGKEDFLMAKVNICLKKLGVFKVKG